MDPFSKPFKALVAATVEHAVQAALSKHAPSLAPSERDRPGKELISTT
jgi:hypothetical protein